jgi:catechol 2,3-dioxygenase-like lactoylglutathione lyase family enzyme
MVKRRFPPGSLSPTIAMMGDGRILGIAGVLIWTEAERFGAMARFYRDSLGLTPRTSKPDFINFDWGGVRLSVSVHDRVRGASADPFRIMVNLAVDDIVAVHARLERAGVVFSRRPETEDWGGRVASFLDPDGNLIQLMQLPD